MTSQKDIFLASEGDAWFRRNQPVLETRDWATDPVCVEVADVGAGRSLRIVEIGCGEGSRLLHLRQAGHTVCGIDPSQSAVERAVARGVPAQQGTADSLPFAAASFDLVIFGFCLYLCDDADLFRIAAEADRVLAGAGWLIIFDFTATAPVYKPYHHYSGVWSRKMDYTSAFLWHPAYTLARYRKLDHAGAAWTDDPDCWVSVACLRKRSRSVE